MLAQRKGETYIIDPEHEKVPMAEGFEVTRGLGDLEYNVVDLEKKQNLESVIE
jgi:hypothetical protein